MATWPEGSSAICTRQFSSKAFTVTAISFMSMTILKNFITLLAMSGGTSFGTRLTRNKPR